MAAASYTVNEPWPGTGWDLFPHTPLEHDTLRKATAGTLTAGQLVTFLDSDWHASSAWVANHLLPILAAAKLHNAPVVGKWHVSNEGGIWQIGVTVADGDHVYPIGATIDPGVLDRIKILAGIARDVIVAPIKATIAIGEFLYKLGEFLFNPVRMGELVVGGLLVVVGVNAVLKNPAGKAAAAGGRVAATARKVG